MMFRTQYDRLQFRSEIGSREAPTYRAAVDSDGKIDLIQDGIVNVYDEIQSHRDSCDIELMIKRFENGDVTALNRGNPVFLDTVDMPKTFAEVYNVVIQAKNDFQNLPLEVRNAFDHSPEKYFSMIGTEEFGNIMSKFYPQAKNDININNPAPVAGTNIEPEPKNE